METPPDLGRVFADSGCENQAIQAAKRRDHGAQFPSNPVDKQSDRLLGPGVPRGKQFAHVVADPGDAEKSALVIEQLLDRIGVHAALAQEIKDHPRIERAAARAHGQPVERGEPHCGIDALPVAHCAQAGA